MRNKKKKVIIQCNQEWYNDNKIQIIIKLKNDVLKKHKYTTQEKIAVKNAIQAIKRGQAIICNEAMSKLDVENLLNYIRNEKVELLISRNVYIFKRIATNSYLPGIIASSCSVYTLDGKINSISETEKMKFRVSTYMSSYYKEECDKRSQVGQRTKKCKACKKEMKMSKGCNIKNIIVNGKIYNRIKVGDKNDFNKGIHDTEFRCHDCNAKTGNYHHWDCDAERCPNCNNQLISCGCKYAYIEEIDEKEETIIDDNNKTNGIKLRANSLKDEIEKGNVSRVIVKDKSRLY